MDIRVFSYGLKYLPFRTKAYDIIRHFMGAEGLHLQNRSCQMTFLNSPKISQKEVILSFPEPFLMHIFFVGTLVLDNFECIFLQVF